MITQALQTTLDFKPKHISPPFAWVGHIPFAAALVSEIKPRLIVELGTHTGNSYFTFCQAVQENNLETHCYAVDTWQGEVHAGHYNESVFQALTKYNQVNYSGFSHLLRTTFDDALTQFADNSIDLLHIDGLHTYEAVKGDYTNWLPKVKAGGVILFHDISCRQHDFGVWRLWEEIVAVHPKHFSVLHSNGLGVLVKPGSTQLAPFLEKITSRENEPFWQDIFLRSGLVIQNKYLSAQVYFSNSPEFCESQSVELVYAANEKTAIVFDKFPAVTAGDLYLRFDPANQPGQIIIYKLALIFIDQDGVSKSIDLLHGKEQWNVDLAALPIPKDGYIGTSGDPRMLIPPIHLNVNGEFSIEAELETRNVPAVISDGLLKIIAERDSCISNLSTTLAERDTTISNFLNQVEAIKSKLANVQNSLSWKITEPLRFIFRKIKKPGIIYLNIDSPCAGLFYDAARPIQFSGWIFNQNGDGAEQVRIRLGKRIVLCEKTERLDVCTHFKNLLDVNENVGFNSCLGTGTGLKLFRIEVKFKNENWRTITRKLLFGRAQEAFKEPVSSYNAWVEASRALNLKIPTLNGGPLISVLMPVYNPPVKWLKRAIDSVREQTYDNWQLCIADDASHGDEIRTLLDLYARLDGRINVIYREQNGHISAASNSALVLCKGEFTALLDHDDELAPGALMSTARVILSVPAARLIYSDEDKIDENGVRFDPNFKPDWMPDLLTGQNYLCHLTAYQTQLLRDLNGFRIGFEGSQDWDLALRATERLQADAIVHIPEILYHWRAINGSTAKSQNGKSYHVDAGFRAVTEHIMRTGRNAEISPVGEGHWRVREFAPALLPLVSLIIPTRNRGDILRTCIESVLKLTNYSNFEIIVIDNQSTDSSTLAYFKSLRLQGVSVIRDEGPFNFSALNNRAVNHAKGELVAFINNDIEVITPEWLHELVPQALRPGVGAVGAMLYYPDNRIQHAGVVLGIAGPQLINGVAGHAFKFFKRGSPGYMNRLKLVNNYSAVTAACMVIRKSTFWQVGGFDAENLAVAFNDVDLCLRLIQAGYRNVWTPYAELYHHESASRGAEDTPEKAERAAREANYMRGKWGGFLDSDPAYNPNLTRVHEDFSLAWPPRAPNSKP